MLSEEEKNRIRAEEEAEARALLERDLQVQKIRALESYRADVRSEVRADLQPRARNNWWFLLLIPVLGLTVFALLPRSSPSGIAEDTSGGIANSSLVERCQSEVRNYLNDENAKFPDVEEISSQISSSADGKRWDGWVICPAQETVQKAEFSCQYTPATDQVKVEIIK